MLVGGERRWDERRGGRNATNGVAIAEGNSTSSMADEVVVVETGITRASNKETAAPSSRKPPSIRVPRELLTMYLVKPRKNQAP
ncbi:hypothetical protein K0M31_017213 [Melipona bicolor]|uniref:Uncharacterized protein n=1 Tax=Melipona bicolor TaxID=60889 RepID=A0AA40G5L7_9HYME|nr:hypothetical protein K0M31_017213 [Melipona bicolor]